MPYKNPKKRKEAQRKYDAKRADKRAGTRTRNYTAIMYPEDLPSNWIDMLDDAHVRWICSPLHDKDTNPDGTPKKIHYHILLIYDVVKTTQQIIDLFVGLFGQSETGSIIGVATPQPVTDRCALVRYFAHLDNPSKAQYDIADIIGHNGADPTEILRYSQSETREMMKDIIRYIVDNEITELSVLSIMIMDTHPDWFDIITKQSTIYFNNFIRSHRHNLKKQNETVKAIENGLAEIDENGEIK